MIYYMYYSKDIVATGLVEIDAESEEEANMLFNLVPEDKLNSDIIESSVSLDCVVEKT